MKIVCVHCQVGYQVNLTVTSEEDIEFKCAKCQQKFLIKSQEWAEQPASMEAQSRIAAAKAPQKQGTASADDLNCLLDNLLDEYLAPGTTKSAKTPLNIGKTPQIETADTTGTEKGKGAENRMGDKHIENYADEDFKVTTKKKSGLFTLPITKVGKLIMVGSVMALVLTGGGLYFAWKTFAPDELASKPNKNAQVTETAREAASEVDLSRPSDDFLSEDITSETTQQMGSSPGSEKTIPSPSATEVTLSTVMPVVFNAADVRVLSFNLEIETTDQFSAEVIRKAAPVYEQIMVGTTENFLRNKSYNDTLDINKKLQQKLQNNFNQKIKGGGRIKKIKFKDFIIQ